MIKLKTYQVDAIEAIKLGFTKYFRQYIDMPTGSGKTITFLSYAKDYHKNILIIVPSVQLLKQVYNSALLFFESKEISRKGGDFNEKISRVHICIINSIRGEYLEFIISRSFDLTIVDEAHHSQSDSYKRFFKRRSEIFHEKDMLILGVTATPDRLDGNLLDEVLHYCSFKLNIVDMILSNYLCDIEGFSVKTNIDLSDINDNNKDFSLNDLYNRLCNESRNNLILDIYKEEMMDRKTIIFCINIKHSKEINSLLNLNGISCAHIDGTFKEDKRNSILSSFRNNEISVLCNCQLLTEGFDEPSIDGIILARPTKSKSLFTQMIGRGLRLFPSKQNCKIIDIVDNHKNLKGFNSLVQDCSFKELESFKSINDIKIHIEKERLKVTEFSMVRSDLLCIRKIQGFEALPGMIDYLDKHGIDFMYPISFDEASFLIWFNELKKEYLYVCN